MKKSTPIVLVFIFCFFATPKAAYADSPLTAIDFSKAYTHEPMVQEALSSNGILTSSLLAYITDDFNPIGVKLACIRALGFEVAGKNNYSLLLSYLSEKNNYHIGDPLLYELSADTILCMAYVKGLDQCFEVTEALYLARLARAKAPNSYAIHLVTAMIESQQFQKPDWCMVNRVSDSVRNYPGLQHNLNPLAIQMVFDYMDSYKEYCD